MTPALELRWTYTPEEFFEEYLRAHQGWFAYFIDAMHRKDVLGEINSNGYDSHDFPSQVS